MILTKGKFYVFKFVGNDMLQGFDEDGKEIRSEDVLEADKQVVIFFNEDSEIETRDDLEVREATNLEKEYWIDAMREADENNQNFGGVGLGKFEEWKKDKGYK